MAVTEELFECFYLVVLLMHLGTFSLQYTLRKEILLLFRYTMKRIDFSQAYVAV